jgi:hypothetical protein
MTTKPANNTLASTLQATPMDLEISINTEHQSEVEIPEPTTKKSGISHTNLNAKVQTFTPPVTPYSKQTVTYAEMTSRNLDT